MHMNFCKLDASLVAEAQRLMESAHKIVVFTHIAPDGDAMGSSLAIWHFLKNTEYGIQNTDQISPYSDSETVRTLSAERSVQVITPNAFPEFLAWLPGADKVLVYEGHEKQADPLIAEADLHICLDFNEPKRIGPAGDKLLQNSCAKILIDHHILCDDSWLHSNPQSVICSHPEASSTCELVYRVISSQQSVISNEIATCIYTGLMTDTGNFSYNSNNPELYEIIAQLMRAGINKDDIYNAVFNQYTPDRVRLVGYCLNRKMRLFPEHHLALITLSDAELREYHYKPGDTEGIVNMPLQISDIYYSVFMREQPPKPGTPKPIIKLSFRSQGDRPVNIFAAEVFHGGGHMNASGGDFCGSLNAATQRFLSTYANYLKKD